jgi:hypothetical protein
MGATGWRDRTTCALWVAILGALILLVPDRALAQGGPPLITDDPDTPGPGYWEINLASIVERARSARRIEAPLADINYGVGARIQLKFEIPWLSGSETGQPMQAAPGNANMGVKWRFLGAEGQRIAWSTYPQLEVNTGHRAVSNGLVEEGRRFFLPTELTVQMGSVEINGEVGRTFVQNGEDGWVYGISTEIEFDGGFELLGELHGEQNRPAPTELIVNIGGRKHLTRQLRLLMAAGTGVHGSEDDRVRLRIYVGLQLNLPDEYTLSQRRSVDIKPLNSRGR